MVCWPGHLALHNPHMGVKQELIRLRNQKIEVQTSESFFFPFVLKEKDPEIF